MRRLACAVLAGVLTLGASATDGFYHVERTNGRWMVMTPAGRPFRWFGINHFSPHNGHGGTDSYGRFLGLTNAPVKSEIAWRNSSVRRLRDFGFTLVSLARWEVKLMPSLVDLCGATTICLDIGQNAATEKDERRFITPFRRRACSAMPNVWHSEFERTVDELVKPICTRFRDNKALVGYYLDNELAWWGYTEKETGLFDNIRKKPFGHTARQAQAAFLKKHAKGNIAAFNALWGTHYDSWDAFYADDRTYLPSAKPEQLAAKRGFLKELARRYFSVCTAAIRKYDRNHLILGCRFAGFSGADRVVWEAAGEYCDVISLNCYPTYDPASRQLYNQHVRDQMKRTLENCEQLQPLLEAHASAAGKPVVVTEWSYPADDVPSLGNSRGAGCRLATQQLRAEAAAETLRMFSSSPSVIGCDWFRWVDCPAAGVRADCAEDCNYGLVNEHDEPYPLLVEAFRTSGGK